jgi:FADH2 O2-dependent halogenase
MQADLVVLGAGFAGSLMALVAQKIGLRVVLVEKGKHPRFAIGESSTPITNLVLENLARTYDLPRLLPLAKYGSWQQAYPQIACGLKRGFTFVKHEPNVPFTPRPDHANELLVAANPRDEIGDTHWFREEFDHFLVDEARSADIPYLDQTEIANLDHSNGWRLSGQRLGREVVIDAAFLVDAGGPSGILPRTLGIDTQPEGVRTNSWSIFSHFVDVGWWCDTLSSSGGSTADHPYPCDHAALHHVLDDGWLWVLRFNNGVASAGVLFDGERRAPESAQAPELEWANLMNRYPAVGRQFSNAKRVQPWVSTGRLQRLARCAAGADWAMLAHAAYFFDALFSSGNAHTLLTIERLAKIFERSSGSPQLAGELAEYDARLRREMDFLDLLIHGCYRAFRRFDLLAPFTMYYFAGAIFSEERRRQGLAGERDEVLFSHDPGFREAFLAGYERLLTLTNCQPEQSTAAEFERRVARDIAPYNTAGLCDPAKRNMYPFA